MRLKIRLALQCEVGLLKYFRLVEKLAVIEQNGPEVKSLGVPVNRKPPPADRHVAVRQDSTEQSATPQGFGTSSDRATITGRSRMKQRSSPFYRKSRFRVLLQEPLTPRTDLWPERSMYRSSAFGDSLVVTFKDSKGSVFGKIPFQL